ncbi:hypothetical protein B0H13DRAFT_1857618 [Mycena leptocephala]|nr:hypothetical protein B0H13DRAFT_1857618 [Mycena leptocephala]
MDEKTEFMVETPHLGDDGTNRHGLSWRARDLKYVRKVLYTIGSATTPPASPHRRDRGAESDEWGTPDEQTDGGDEDACKTEWGRIEPDAGRDEEDSDGYEDNGVAVVLAGAGSTEGKMERQASSSDEGANPSSLARIEIKPV